MKQDRACILKQFVLIAVFVFILAACDKSNNRQSVDEQTINANEQDGAQEDHASAELEQETPVYNQSAKQFLVAIDAGHQKKGNNELEPIGPGASESKPKVSDGTQGVSTNVPEHILTLAVSLKLRDELLSRGYKVFMIRETNDVNISNSERAFLAADAGADIFVRIHADGSENSGVNGIMTICSTNRNPFVPQLYIQSRALSDFILNAMVAATGAENRGVLEVDNMSGINWSAIPVTIIEMGLMTNPAEDRLMQTDEYQRKLVSGISDGIDLFFASLEAEPSRL